MIAPNETVQVGQLWSVGGLLYEVQSLDGSDACYPILMREVARDHRALAGERAAIENDPLPTSRRARLAAFEKPRAMDQELAWFRLRKDVERWTGTREAWLESRRKAS